MRYQFLEFVLDTDQQTLASASGAIALRNQSFRVLHYLLEQAPAVVTKEEILNAVWGHQAISSSAVAQTIRELRELLDDHAEHPRMIETRHRVGYRFIASVITDPPVEVAGVNPPFADHVQRVQRIGKGSRMRLAVLMLAAIAALLSGFLLWDRFAEFSASDPPRTQAEDASRQVVFAAIVAARNFDTAKALEDVQRARAKHDFPRIKLWLARLHIMRGEIGAAAQLLAELEAIRSRLQRGDQLLLDALQNEITGRYTAALDAWQILYEMDPLDVDVGLALFDMQIHERSEDASKTYERLNRLQGVPLERQLLMSAQHADLEHQIDRQSDQAQAAIAAAGSRWPAMAALARIEIGRVLKGRGKISEAREMFARAETELEQQGLLRTAMELRLDQIDPALFQGDLDGVNAELKTLQKRAEESGDAYSIGRVLHARGRLARRTGKNEEAIAFYAAAAKQHESIGNLDGVASALSAQAGPLRRSGRRDEAQAVLTRALLLAEESGSASVRASIHGNLANQASTEARYAHARHHYEAALSLFREVHDKSGEAVTLGNLANVATYSGDLRDAEKLNREALALFRSLKQPGDVGRILIDVASASLESGDLSEAGRFADEASGIFRHLGDPKRLAIALALGADVKIHSADPDRAEDLLDDADRTGKLELGEQAIIATLRGRIALLRDQRSIARERFNFALEQRVTAGDRTMQQVSRLDIAGLDLFEGRLVEAEQTVLAVVVQSREDRQPSSERSARILLAEILLHEKRPDDAERELVAARALLDATPQFDDEAAWTLMRALVDSSAKRVDRLEWLAEHARKHRQHLLELRVTGMLYEENADPRIRQWREEVRSLGLLALLRPRLSLGT